PERGSEILDALAVVEETLLDQPQGRRDTGRRPAPRGRPRRGLRPAAQARPEARSLGRRRRGEEDDVPRLGGPHRTGGTTVDARRQHAGVEAAVEARIAGEPCAVTGPRIERATRIHDGREPTTARGG